MSQDPPNPRDARFPDRYEKNRVGDTRTQAQKDRDRILHSGALRRLANVTQVVDPGEGHIFHNRLTHTLKVAQIARSLAEHLCKTQGSTATALGLDPDVVEAAALAHDLGHPPFGHVAERELDRLVKQHGLSEGYEGNPQSFRILTKLEIKGPDVAGLDLTRATLNAVLKYPRLRQMIGEGQKKWGAYWTEQEQFEWVRRYHHNDLRSVEAEIMDWADDIAFSIHDVEDFYRAGLIPTNIFSNEVSTADLEAYLQEVLNRWKRDKPGSDDPIPDLKQLKETFKKYTLLLPLAAPFNPSRGNVANLRVGISRLIERYLGAISLNDEAVEDRNKRTVMIKSEFRTEIRLLKGLTWRYVIHNRALATQQYGKQVIIRELFSIFFQALDIGDGEAKFVLPEDYEEQLHDIESDLPDDDESKRKTQAQVRLVADIISSMSDNEALAMYKRLTGWNPGSVLERVPH